MPSAHRVRLACKILHADLTGEKLPPHTTFEINSINGRMCYGQVDRPMSDEEMMKWAIGVMYEALSERKPEAAPQTGSAPPADASNDSREAYFTNRIRELQKENQRLVACQIAMDQDAPHRERAQKMMTAGKWGKLGESYLKAALDRVDALERELGQENATILGLRLELAKSDKESESRLNLINSQQKDIRQLKDEVLTLRATDTNQRKELAELRAADRVGSTTEENLRKLLCIERDGNRVAAAEIARLQGVVNTIKCALGVR